MLGGSAVVLWSEHSDCAAWSDRATAIVTCDFVFVLWLWGRLRRRLVLLFRCGSAGEKPSEATNLGCTVRQTQRANKHAARAHTHTHRMYEYI